MAEKENCKLFSEFAPNTMQEWIDKVTVDLKGADFNKTIIQSQLDNGFLSAVISPGWRLLSSVGGDTKRISCIMRWR